MKKIGSFIASMSPMRTRKPNDDDLLSDAFPYHQSIIPSKGSIRGSVFNLAGATLGAGALSLPYAVAVSGLGFAVAQLVLAAVLTVYTIRLLIRAEDITKLKSYEDLAMYCFGTKVLLFWPAPRLTHVITLDTHYPFCLAADDNFRGGEYPDFLLRHFSCVPRDARRYHHTTWRALLWCAKHIRAAVGAHDDIMRNDHASSFVDERHQQSSVFLHSGEDISWTIELSRGPDFMLSVPIVMFAFTCQVSQRVLDLHRAAASVYSPHEQGCGPCNADFLPDLSVHWRGGVSSFRASTRGTEV
ncbi:hypothetical protein ON010_g10645 [Phytophthora cinnamomi]|nr:hypothetical protein ON010_g10645 [Phytophthora cinnamomi]